MPSWHGAHMVPPPPNFIYSPPFFTHIRWMVPWTPSSIWKDGVWVCWEALEVFFFCLNCKREWNWLKRPNAPFQHNPFMCRALEVNLVNRLLRHIQGFTHQTVMVESKERKLVLPDKFIHRSVWWGNGISKGAIGSADKHWFQLKYYAASLTVFVDDCECAGILHSLCIPAHLTVHMEKHCLLMQSWMTTPINHFLPRKRVH